MFDSTVVVLEFHGLPALVWTPDPSSTRKRGPDCIPTHICALARCEASCACVVLVYLLLYLCRVLTNFLKAVGLSVWRITNGCTVAALHWA